MSPGDQPRGRIYSHSRCYGSTNIQQRWLAVANCSAPLYYDPGKGSSMPEKTVLPPTGDPSTTGVAFQRVRTRRSFEAVCDQIRQQLAKGELRPGNRLPSEKELAEQFDIGRSGVREALRSLEAAGLVEARTGINGGFYISNGNATASGLAQTVQDMVSLGQVSI